MTALAKAERFRMTAESGQERPEVSGLKAKNYGTT
jgi:hypothetical protein